MTAVYTAVPNPKVFISSLPLRKQNLIRLNEKPLITPGKVLLLIKKHMKTMFLRSIYFQVTPILTL